MELVSPSGAVSKLSPPFSGLEGTAVPPAIFPLTATFRFGSAKHLGENAAGVWKLRIADHSRTIVGTLKSWNITARGHGSSPGGPDIDEVDPGVGALTVSWKAPADIGGSSVTSYDLRYILSDAPAKADDHWRVEEGVWTSGNLAYTVAGLEDDNRYDLQIRAVNDAGPGPWSAKGKGTPSTSAPSAPAIASIIPGDGTLAVAWTAPADTGAAAVIAYDARYIETTGDETADANWTVLDSVWTNGDLVYVIRGLANGVEYDVQVRGVNSAGDGPWSITFTGTPRQEDVSVTLYWEQTKLTVDEGAATVTLRAVSLTGEDREPLADFTFDATVATAAGSASPTGDYGEVSTTATFAAADYVQETVGGVTRYRAVKELTVVVTDDELDEPDEELTAALAYSVPGLPHLLTGATTATVTITDNDHVPVTVGWRESAVPVDEGSGTVTLYAVAVTTKDKRPEDGFSFQALVSTSAGSALSPDDYARLFDTVTFTRSDFRRATVNGQRRYRAAKQVTVTIADDTIDEAAEGFDVTSPTPTPASPTCREGPPRPRLP